MQTYEPTPKIMHMILASPTLKVRFTTYRTAFSVQLSYMMSALYEFPTVGWPHTNHTVPVNPVNYTIYYLYLLYISIGDTEAAAKVFTELPSQKLRSLRWLQTCFQIANFGVVDFSLITPLMTRWTQLVVLINIFIPTLLLL